MKKGFGILIVLAVCIWLFVITSINLGITRSGRMVSRLQSEVSLKEARNQYEELEIARLSSPQTVITFAREQLGLVESKPHEVVILEGKK